MQHFHFNTCPAIPLKVKEIYLNLRGNMNNRRGDDKISPKDYWIKSCAEMGMVDHTADDGSNGGVKLIEDNGLVKRERLPEYAKVLFMPPESKDEEMEEKEGEENGDDGEAEMAQDLGEEMEAGESNEGLDDSVVDMDEEQDDGEGKCEEQDDGEGKNDDQDDEEGKSDDQDDGEGERDDLDEELDDGEGKSYDLEEELDDGEGKSDDQYDGEGKSDDQDDGDQDEESC